MIQLQRRAKAASRLRSFVMSVCFPIWLCHLATLPANAGFVGAYDLSNFTLTNTDADGSVMTPDAGLSVVLFGGNTGRGLAGSTDLLIVAPETGFVEFHYAYSSLDFPSFDQAGFMLGGVFLILADTDGQSGASRHFVSSGTAFGFRVATDDNTGEPGILTISDFSGPTGLQATPEPATSPMLLALIAAAAASRCRLNRNRRRRGGSL